MQFRQSIRTNAKKQKNMRIDIILLSTNRGSVRF